MIQFIVRQHAAAASNSISISSTTLISVVFKVIMGKLLNSINLTFPQVWTSHVFQFLEVGQAISEGPSLISVSRPIVVVFLVAPHINHGIYGACATDDFASPPP